MQNLLNDLTLLLEQDNRLVAEGKLLKIKVVELALVLDPGLIKQLLKHDAIRKHFFVEVEGVLVFDKIKFQRFVSNKQFLPDSYTAFKNKIGLTTNGEYLTESKEVVLSWPYKDCVLEGGQDKEDAKRNEVFWNETLAPDQIDRLLSAKVMTSFKRYDKDGAHPVAELSLNDNLIIKGNNLLALHTLRKVYAGKVKLIYIDPPYNTGTDSFRYNDNFNHSTWLTFMRNRLQVAWGLLSQDGAIFVQCDDSEYVYLKAMCDEIFRAENYEITFYVQVRYGEKTLSERNSYQKLIEQVLVYKKPAYKPKKQTEDYSIEKFEWEIVEKTDGKATELKGRKVKIFKKGEYEIKKVASSITALKETWASGTVLKANASGKFFNDFIAPRLQEDGLEVLYKVEGIGEDGIGYRYFTGPKRDGATKGKFYSGVPLTRVEEINSGGAVKEKVIMNYLNFADSFGNSRSEGGVELRSGKKPEDFLRFIIEMASNKSDIVLDFFLGTGSTAATALKMGRRFIGVEQLDYGDNDSVKRIINVIGGDKTGISEDVDWQGGGSFVYCELSQANQEFIDQIQAAKSSKDLHAIWQVMQERAFLSYKLNPKIIDANTSEFELLALADQQRFLVEVLDKNLLYVPYSEIDDVSYAVSEEDKKLNRQFFNL